MRKSRTWRAVSDSPLRGTAAAGAQGSLERHRDRAFARERQLRKTTRSRGRGASEARHGAASRHQPKSVRHAREGSEKLSIEPHALEPTCEEYQAVLDAGSADIARLLTLVADTTAREVEKVLSRAGSDPNQIVVVYGGAIHNDATPSPERADWSFGPRFEERTGGRYVELDLIVPEFIKDTDTWRALPWYSHYDATRDGASAVLFRPAPHSFVLIFPRTPAAAIPPSASSAEP